MLKIVEPREWYTPTSFLYAVIKDGVKMWASAATVREDDIKIIKYQKKDLQV